MKKKLTEKDIESILEENKKLKEENKRLHQIFDCVKKNILDFEDELTQLKDAAKARRLEDIKQAYIDTGDGLAGKLKLKITDLPLKIRTMNILKSVDCDTLGDIVAKDKTFFMQCRNMGRNGLDDIMNVLELYGLDFGMDVK